MLPRVEPLDHMAVLRLGFWGASILLPWWRPRHPPCLLHTASVRPRHLRVSGFR